MSTTLTLRANVTVTDTSHAAQGSLVELYQDVVSPPDSLIFSAGSAAVADGQPIPSEDELNRAATLLSDSVDVEVEHYFLAKPGDNLLYEIFNAGSQNKRYVFCASFDGETASEPILEAWDDDTMTTIVSPVLGFGVPANSWYKAVCTTLGLPGASWAGTPLAGDGVSNSLLLNNGSGALAVASDLYFNFKVLIPVGTDTPGNASPILAITYTTN